MVCSDPTKPVNFRPLISNFNMTESEPMDVDVTLNNVNHNDDDDVGINNEDEDEVNNDDEEEANGGDPEVDSRSMLEADIRQLSLIIEHLQEARSLMEKSLQTQNK